MTTLPYSLQWLKPPGYRYEPTPLTPAQQAEKDRFERARPTLAAQPQNVNPQQVGQVLGAQGQGSVNTQLDAGRTAGQIGIENMRGLNEVEGQAYRQKKDMDANFYRTNYGTYTDNEIRRENSRVGNALTVADRLAGMGSEMGGRVAGAISGEQANDAARLKILERALQPTLVDNISGIAGAIAPLLAAFVV